MKRLLLLLAVLHSSFGLLHSQVPNLVSYQGRVAVGTVNFDGTGQFKFALVNTNGSTTYWSNSPDTSPADGVPDNAVTLTVTKGLYSVLLGDTNVTNMTAIPASVWTNADVRLRVWFNDGTNGFQLLSPDQRLAPNGYLPDGGVTSAKMADGAISTAKIAAGAVGATQLSAGSVDSTKLAAATVQAGNIASGQVVKSLTKGATTLTDAITLVEGPNITIAPSGNTITISASGTVSGTPNVTHDASLTGNGGASALGVATGGITSGLIANGAVGSTQLGGNLTLGGTTTISGGIALPATTSSTVGVITQGGSSLVSTFGTNNFFAGLGAGNFTTSGIRNVATGAQALAANTSGGDNTANGHQALNHNTTGNVNSAFGKTALFGNFTGSANTAVGAGALNNNFSGDNNIAVGVAALNNNTGGGNNVAVGNSALSLGTNGNNNIAIGNNAGSALTNGAAFNIDIGHPGVAGESNKIRIGDGTTQTDTYLTGVIHGNASGLTFSSLALPATTSSTVGVITQGASSLISTYGTNNFFAGLGAGNFTTTGTNNVATGAQALAADTLGGDNTAIGFQALNSNTAGNSNSAFGKAALFKNTSGSTNTALGAGALNNNSSGGNNVAVGFSALNNTNSANNVAVGASALSSNTSGQNNIGIGTNAGSALTTGSNNIDIGNDGVAGEFRIIRIGTYPTHTDTYLAGVIHAPGDAVILGNVGIGVSPAFPLHFSNSLGDKISFYGTSGNIVGIGLQSSLLQIHTDNSGADIAFGYGSSASLTETMRIKGTGNVGIGTASPTTKLDVAGDITCVAVNVTSDRNSKEHFKPVNTREVLDKVIGMPITEWQYKTQDDARHIGPMAQDFHEAFTLGHDERHIATVDEGGVALAAIQGLNEKLEQQLEKKNAELERMKKENQSLAERLAAIESKLGIDAPPAK